MKRIKRRTIISLILVFILIAGLMIYFVRYLADGDKWATFAANKNVYTDGILSTGTVLDRNGVVLASADNGVRIYASDSAVRIATFHAVGDPAGNIGTGALSAFKSELTGYDWIDGTYSVSESGTKLHLTIDSALNEVAYDALSGRNGTVAVYNYETGEILCMVSSPSYDPEDPPDLSENSDEYEGVYINRFLSSAYTPGSIFKLVTLAAAIENIPDLYDREFECTGGLQVGEEYVTCTAEHGTLTIEDALAVSCNSTFGQLALELGPEILAEYAEKFGLTESHTVNDIKTAAGNFDEADEDTANLAWSGIGQYMDTVNPEAFLRIIGAIANNGVAVEPRLILKVDDGSLLNGLGYSNTSKERLIDSDTADAIALMMNYNVSYTYGNENFPGLELYAKSGTAEVGADVSPHAWFVGFIKNEDYPLAFVVIVENGGWGSLVAGSVANTVLQAAVGN